MGLVIALVSLLLMLFEFTLIARAVLDWTAVLAGPPAYGTVRGRLTGLARALTEPVLGPVRRALPPVRLGSMAIDLAFIVVFVAVLLLRQLLFWF